MVAIAIVSAGRRKADIVRGGSGIGAEMPRMREPVKLWDAPGG
jgi:hypothetical protein